MELSIAQTTQHQMRGYLENKMLRLSWEALTKSLGRLSWWLPGGPEDNSDWLEYAVGH